MELTLPAFTLVNLHLLYREDKDNRHSAKAESVVCKALVTTGCIWRNGGWEGASAETTYADVTIYINAKQAKRARKLLRKALKSRRWSRSQKQLHVILAAICGR